MPTMPRNPTMVPGDAYHKTKNFFDTLYANPAAIADQPLRDLQNWTRKNEALLRAAGTCAVCGKDVRGKGVIDRNGKAGRGRGVVLCPYHAMSANVGKVAQFSPATRRKLNPPPGPQQPGQEQEKSPNLWEAFVGGWDAPNMTYEQWMDRYFTKGKKPRKPNWFQRTLLPPQLRKLYR